MPASILIVNGPNLNMLGKREPELYGTQALADIEAACRAEAKALGLTLDWFQSNHEGAIIDALHNAHAAQQAVIINAGAYTHTSIAIMDALLMIKQPVIEVHLSNIFRREEFRHQSYISKASHGVICGFGAQSYLLGLRAMQALLSTDRH